VDALTLSMAREIAPVVSLQTAALAIAIGVLSNTTLKLGIALVIGAGAFRTIVAGALLAMGAAAVVPMV
jgi:uncharacterized membrane protein (DUF4010 family)